MMKLSEKTKNFILYGIENKIERKEIYKFDGAILFLCFLAMVIADSTPSPSFYRIFLILFYVVFVIATFSKSDVTGEKNFLDSWHSRFRNEHFVRLVWDYSHVFNIRKGRL